MPADRPTATPSDRPRDAPQETLRLVVGRIGRAHGLRGEVNVEVRTDDPDARFAPGAVLETDPPRRGPLTVGTGRVQGGRLVVQFAGVEDRTAAEALQGTLLIAEADPHELPDDPDEYYDYQLEGLRVVTLDGREVGTVAEMLHLPTQDLFAVKRPDGREVLVPFVGEIVPEVDLDGGTVRIDPPPGLLELADSQPGNPRPDEPAQQP
jgi:16S rRNA processing protein RimM